MSDEHKIQIVEWYMMDKTKYFSLGVLNSFVLRSVMYPLVLVRTRIQVQRKSTVYSGAFDAFKKIKQCEGVRGLYKGFWVNSIQVCSSFIYLSTYEKTRDLVTKYTSISDSRAKAFLSGGISSAMSQTLVIPFDVISQHIMMALYCPKNSSKLPSANFKSSFFKSLSLNQEELRQKGLAIAITKQLYRENGLNSFYRGYIASLLCLVPSSACWWMFYSAFNEYFLTNDMTNKLSCMQLQVMSGVISGGMVSVMTNPLDLLRANFQVHRPSSYKSAVKYLWKEDKFRIFNKGLTARMTQSCLSSGLIVIGYETMKKLSLSEEYRDQIKW